MIHLRCSHFFIVNGEKKLSIFLLSTPILPLVIWIGITWILRHNCKILGPWLTVSNSYTRESWILRPSSFWIPRNLSHHTIRQGTGDTVLAKNGEDPNTAVVAGGEGLKTTENKIHWPHCRLQLFFWSRSGPWRRKSLFLIKVTRLFCLLKFLNHF